MAQTAAHLVDQVLPDVPVRQWVLSLPIPLRYLLAAHPKLLSPALEIVQRVITGYLVKKSALPRSETHTDAVTLIQRFGSAVNLNIHFHNPTVLKKGIQIYFEPHPQKLVCGR